MATRIHFLLGRRSTSLYSGKANTKYANIVILNGDK